MTRTRTTLGVAGATALGATALIVTALGTPATAAQSAASPGRSDVPGMQRMRELMAEGNPGMQRMHQLMRDGAGASGR